MIVQESYAPKDLRFKRIGNYLAESFNHKIGLYQNLASLVNKALDWFNDLSARCLEEPGSIVIRVDTNNPWCVG